MKPVIDHRPGLPPGVWLRRPLPTLPFPLEEPNCRLYAWGRVCLLHGMRGLGLSKGDAVLAPAYHCGAEIQAIVQAGLECTFYEATKTLEPDEGELDALVTARTRALLLIHYFGLPQDAAHWRRWCDERGLLLIEDASQAWLSSTGETPVGSMGDLSIFSLHKTIGVPNGAALVSGFPAESPDYRARTGAIDLFAVTSRWLRGRSLLPAPSATKLLPGGVVDQDWSFDSVDRPPSWLTKLAIPRLADPAAAHARLSNYRSLSEALGELVPAGQRHAPDGASPYVFPICATDKKALLQHLVTLRIVPRNVWPIAHPATPAHQFPRAAALRGEIVGLPVHQELRPHDLERIVDAVRDAL